MFKKLLVAFSIAGSIGSAHAIAVVEQVDASVLASALMGPGVTLSNATLTYSAVKPSGTFSGGLSSVGFDSGIMLSTGSTDCVAGPNTSGSCTGSGTSSSLKFDFESNTGQIFFSYVFASEEYNSYVNSGFNDKFELLLNGENIALLPGTAGPVSINNVNCLTNSAYYRNNVDGEGNQGPECTNQHLDIQFDGLTTVLVANANLLAGKNTFEFVITDVADSSLDSAVFIKAGSFSSEAPNAVPEPGTATLLGVGLLGFFAARRKKIR